MMAKITGLCGKSTNKVQSLKNQAEYEQIMVLKKTHLNNISAQVFCPTYYKSLSPELQTRLIQCCRSGFENPSSGMGIYANQPDDYETFRPFFEKALSKYHNVDLSKTKHVNSWDLSKIADLPDDKLDLTTLGLPPLSMRVRVGRNLKRYPLPASMTREDRVNLEKDMQKVFDELIQNPNFGGGYNSLTPNHPNFINEQQYKDLVK